MTGTLLGVLIALAGLGLAAWIGRQERTAWRPALLGGVTGIAGVGALSLTGLDQRGLVSSVGALVMYGAAVAAVAIMANRGRS